MMTYTCIKKAGKGHREAKKSYSPILPIRDLLPSGMLAYNMLQTSFLLI
jgi:hypothetical protein